MAKKDGEMRVVELEPEPKPEGATLADALRGMDPDLAVDPVSEAEGVEEEVGGEEGPESTFELAEDEIDREEPAEEPVDEPPVEPEDEIEPEPEEEEELEEEPEEERAPFVLQVGEVELELDVEDDETREALEGMRNDLARVKDLDATFDRIKGMAAQNAEDRAELADIEEQLKTDPVGYVSQRIHPEWRKQLAVELLYDDDILRAVEEQLNEWMDDPAKRREAAAEAKVRRIEQRQAIQQRRAQGRAERENAQVLWNRVLEMTPDDMDHTTAKMWHRDAFAEIQNYVRSNNIETLNPDDLPKILASRMRLYGIGGNNARRKVKPAQPADDRGKKLASETGERFRKKVARRRSAASAPAGAGGAPGRTQLPKDATLDEALAALKARTIGQ